MAQVLVNDMVSRDLLYVHDFISGDGLYRIDCSMVNYDTTHTLSPILSQDPHPLYIIDAEGELTELLTENISREIDNQILQELRDMVPIEPLPMPDGRLFYFTPNRECTINRITDSSWSFGNLYESKIGIKMELEPHKFTSV